MTGARVIATSSSDAKLERLRNDPQIVQAKIEPERETHQVPLAHVFVLILIDRLEP